MPSNKPLRCLFACIKCDSLPTRLEELEVLDAIIFDLGLPMPDSVERFQLSSTAVAVFVGFSNLYRIELNILFTEES